MIAFRISHLIFGAALVALSPFEAVAGDEQRIFAKIAGKIDEQSLRPIDLGEAKTVIATHSRFVGDSKTSDCYARSRQQSLQDVAIDALECLQLDRLHGEARQLAIREFGNLLVDTTGFPADDYFEKEDLAFFQNWDDVGTIGVQMTVKDDQIAVLNTYRGSPLRDLGVGEGWRLVGIDGESFGPDDLERALNALRGDIGSEVLLDLLDPDGAPRSLTVARAKIDLADYALDWNIDGETMTVKLFELTLEAPAELRLAIEGAPSGTRRIVLDLRANRGGLFTEALAISDLFVANGVIATLRNRSGIEEVHRADGTDIAAGLDIVVLVDAETASGAELIAAVLQDHRRATIIGGRTYGHGTVRRMIAIAPDVAITVTTEEILRPNGEPIDGRGVIPDCAEYDPTSEDACLVRTL